MNLPIFESHVSMVITWALKNIKGTIQDKVHYQMHQIIFVDVMIDLWPVIKADLTIVDFIRAPRRFLGPIV